MISTCSSLRQRLTLLPLSHHAHIKKQSSSSRTPRHLPTWFDPLRTPVSAPAHTPLYPPLQPSVMLIRFHLPLLLPPPPLQYLSLCLSLPATVLDSVPPRKGIWTAALHLVSQASVQTPRLWKICSGWQQFSSSSEGMLLFLRP